MDLALPRNGVAEIHNIAISRSIDRITNQIFKLLPLREEEKDWQTQLDNIVIEVGGLAKVMSNHYDLFPLLYKLYALRDLEFPKYRKIIFECCGHCTEMKKTLCLD